jgi:hypothetical protein
LSTSCTPYNVIFSYLKKNICQKTIVLENRLNNKKYRKREQNIGTKMIDLEKGAKI